MAQMIMDATQPLSNAFDMIWNAFSPTVNANKMFFLYLLNYHELLLVTDYIDFLSTAVRNMYIRSTTYEKLLLRTICNELNCPY